MLYYLSLDYSIVDEEGFKNRPYGSLTYDEKPYHVIAKRVTRPHYHKQLPKNKIKLFSTWETDTNKFRNHKVVVEQYEVSRQEYDKMEEKPPLVEIQKGNNTKGRKTYMQGWNELHYDDDATLVLQYLIKDKKQT